METKELQNAWFGTLHTEHLKKEEVVVVPDNTIEHVVTEDDLVSNPEFIEEGVVVGDTIEIKFEPENTIETVVETIPKTVKVRKVRTSKKK
jgi:UDP-glucose 6-dehydrogenase